MLVIVIVFGAFCGLGMFFINFVMMPRNHKVREFRIELSRQIRDACITDIWDGLHRTHRHLNRDRWAAFAKVSYESMLFRFWKPLKAEAFYEDLWFLRPKDECNV